MRQLVTLALVVTSLSACGVSQEQYTAKEMEANKYKANLNSATGRLSELEQENAGLKERMNALEMQLSDTSARAAATGAAKSQLEAATAQRESKVLSQQLLFPENSSKLTAEAKRVLDSAAEATAQLRDKAVIVAAYTDDNEAGGKAGAAKRWQLSTSRALEVAKYLASRDLDPKMIAVAGFGEARPVAPNDSLANRALNRRAEIILTPAALSLGTVQLNPATLQK